MWLRVQVQETVDWGTNFGPILFTGYIILDICYLSIKINYGSKYGILIQTIFLISKKINLQHIAQDLETF